MSLGTGLVVLIKQRDAFQVKNVEADAGGHKTLGGNQRGTVVRVAAQAARNAEKFERLDHGISPS